MENETENRDSVYLKDMNIDSETLDALQRDWIITLELERTSLPKVCKANLVVADRPGCGKFMRNEMLLTHIVRLEPSRELQCAVPSAAKNSMQGPALSDERPVPSTAHDPDAPEVNNDNLDSLEVDDHGWPIYSLSQDDESDGEGSLEMRSTASDQGEQISEPMPYYSPTNMSVGEQHTFVHHKLEGLAEWTGDYFTVVIGHQGIPFEVPNFLLTRNFEFFRAVFEAERWMEATANTVKLKEESPVDFVLLLRFIIHGLVQDLNQIVDPCYPFSLNSNPLRPNREYGQDVGITIAPWIMRVVAMAERLCFNGPDSRLTHVLEATLKVSSTDRVSPAMMDWLFNNSTEGPSFENSCMSGCSKVSLPEMLIQLPMNLTLGVILS